MLKATGHHVLVKQAPIKRKFGSIIIAHEDEKLSQNAVQIGKIVDIGPTAWESFGPDWKGAAWAKVGDLVYFPRYAGGHVEDPYSGEEFILMADEDIKIIVTEGENPQMDVPEFEMIIREENLGPKQRAELNAQSGETKERKTYDY